MIKYSNHFFRRSSNRSRFNTYDPHAFRSIYDKHYSYRSIHASHIAKWYPYDSYSYNVKNRYTLFKSICAYRTRK